MIVMRKKRLRSTRNLKRNKSQSKPKRGHKKLRRWKVCLRGPKVWRTTCLILRDCFNFPISNSPKVQDAEDGFFWSNWKSQESFKAICSCHKTSRSYQGANHFVFSSNSSDVALQWYLSLENAKMNDWNKMIEAFAQQYSYSVQLDVSLRDLETTKQLNNELFSDFLMR